MDETQVLFAALSYNANLRLLGEVGEQLENTVKCLCELRHDGMLEVHKDLEDMWFWQSVFKDILSLQQTLAQALDELDPHSEFIRFDGKRSAYGFAPVLVK